MLQIPHTISRDSNIVFQPNFDKITYGKNTFKYYSTHLSNLLPNDVKKSTEIAIFKKSIKKMGRAKVPMYDVRLLELIL